MGAEKGRSEEDSGAIPQDWRSPMTLPQVGGDCGEPASCRQAKAVRCVRLAQRLQIQ